VEKSGNLIAASNVVASGEKPGNESASWGKNTNFLAAHNNVSVAGDKSGDAVGAGEKPGNKSS
jgi:hypothetical protein